MNLKRVRWVNWRGVWKVAGWMFVGTQRSVKVGR